MTNLKDKKVLITGASAGLGAALALGFAEQGATVGICARRADRLAEVVARLQVLSPDSRAWTVDLNDLDGIAAFAAEVENQFGGVDILINNAGNAHGLASIQDGDLDDWDAMLDINVKGLLYVSKAIIPKMIKNNNGFIVNIGSIAAKEVYPNGNVYCASKHAVDALNKAMRIDLNKHNIRVSAIHPGAVETEFSEVRFKGDSERAKTVYANYKALQPEDIADIIHFVITRPYHVNIEDLVVYPSAQASATLIKKDTY